MDEQEHVQREIDQDVEMMREELVKLFPALENSDRDILLRAWLLKSSVLLVVNPRLHGLTESQRTRHRDLVQRVEKKFIASRDEVQHLIEMASFSADQLEFIWGEILSIPSPEA